MAPESLAGDMLKRLTIDMQEEIIEYCRIKKNVAGAKNYDERRKAILVPEEPDNPNSKSIKKEISINGKKIVYYQISRENSSKKKASKKKGTIYFVCFSKDVEEVEKALTSIEKILEDYKLDDSAKEYYGKIKRALVNRCKTLEYEKQRILAKQAAEKRAERIQAELAEAKREEKKQEQENTERKEKIKQECRDKVYLDILPGKNLKSAIEKLKEIINKEPLEILDELEAIIKENEEEPYKTAKLEIINKYRKNASGKDFKPILMRKISQFIYQEMEDKYKLRLETIIIKKNGELIRSEKAFLNNIAKPKGHKGLYFNKRILIGEGDIIVSKFGEIRVMTNEMMNHTYELIRGNEATIDDAESDVDGTKKSNANQDKNEEYLKHNMYYKQSFITRYLARLEAYKRMNNSNPANIFQKIKLLFKTKEYEEAAINLLLHKVINKDSIKPRLFRKREKQKEDIKEPTNSIDKYRTSTPRIQEKMTGEKITELLKSTLPEEDRDI